MVSAALIRKIASLLLVLCFFLPLSKCAAKQAPSGEMQSSGTIFYPGALLAIDVQDPGPVGLGRIIRLTVLFATFFLPVAMIGMPEPWGSGVQFGVAFPSLHWLLTYTFMGTPQIGGLLALACWACLLGLSTFTLWSAFRQRRRT